MKVYKYFSLLCFFSLILFSNCLINGVFVEAEEMLAKANEVGFDDRNFYGCVVEYYNKENSTNFTIDDKLTDEQLASIDELICKNKGVTSTKGIEKLLNLTKLNLMENKFDSVDLSLNTKLMYVELSGNPNLFSIDLTKNILLREIYFRNDSLKNIDVSNNVDLENLDLGYNELTNIDLTNNVNLKYLYLGSNKLEIVDLSKNVNLVEVTLSNNKISNISLPNIDTLKKMDLQDNRIKNIDVSKYINLEKLVLSGNELTNIDLVNNVNLKELYISSNNLKDLDLSNLSKLGHINAVFNNFDGLSIYYPENIIDLVIEADWIKDYQFDKFTNLGSLRIVDYYIIPVYGTSFEVINLDKYKFDGLSYSDYVLYSSFDKGEDSYVDSSGVISGELGKKLEYTVCSDKVEVVGLDSYSGIIYYDGYLEFRFMTLVSDKYHIDDDNGIIDVDIDDDDTVLNNLNVSWKDAVIDINNDKLEVYYNNELLKEYKLNRVINPSTGSLYVYVVLFILFCSVLGICFYKFKIMSNNSV